MRAREILLSEALKRAAAKRLPVDAIKWAVDNGEIASRRDGAGQLYVRWRDILRYVEGLIVY